MATEDGETDAAGVPPLEHRAHFDIDTDDGYVRIDQSVGDQPLYTPTEAREIAASIVEAADEASADAE